MRKNAITNRQRPHLRWVLLVVLLLYLPAILLKAQTTPVKQWDKTFGGNREDGLFSLLATPDGGYLLGGSSESALTGDKTEQPRGFSDFWVVKLNADGSKAWDKTYGGDGYDELRSLSLTSDGGYLLGGTSNSTVSGDKSEESKGKDDFWVVKLNPDGSKAWDKTFGGDGDEMLIAMTATPDGGFLLGGSSESGVSGDKTEASRGFSDFWVVKLNADGSKAWDKTYGGSEWDGLYALTTTTDGGFLLGGYSLSDISGDKSEANRGNFDYWVVKLNANGSKAWDKTLGGASPDYLSAVIATADGGFLLGGHSWSDITGDKTEATSGRDDYWIVKLNANGSKAWDKTFGGSDSDELQSLVVTADGGYLLAGTSWSGISGEKTEAPKGDSDYWVVKVSSDGSKAWDKTFGGSDWDVLRAVTTTADRGYLLGGYSRSGISGDKTEANRGNFDYWVVKLSGGAPASILAAADPAQFMVYPNPNQGQFYILLPGLQQGTTPVELVLYNTLGQQVFRRHIKGTELQQGYLLKTSAIAAGTYYLQVHDRERVLTRKVMLE